MNEYKLYDVNFFLEKRLNENGPGCHYVEKHKKN